MEWFIGLLATLAVAAIHYAAQTAGAYISCRYGL